MKKKLLFICTANMDRSPTAELMFKDSPGYEAKSAGTSETAFRHINQELIDWADVIFVMNENTDKHLTYLKNNFKLEGKKLVDLDIPDIYRRQNQSLTEILKVKLSEYLKDS